MPSKRACDSVMAVASWKFHHTAEALGKKAPSSPNGPIDTVPPAPASTLISTCCTVDETDRMIDVAAPNCAAVTRNTVRKGSVPANVNTVPDSVTLPLLACAFSEAASALRKMNRAGKSMTVPCVLTPGGATVTAHDSVDGDADPYTRFPPDNTAPDVKFK